MIDMIDLDDGPENLKKCGAQTPILQENEFSGIIREQKAIWQ
jgi:hypothetical protein